MGCTLPLDMCAFTVNILYKSIAGSYWPVRVADGPITARYRFIKNASWVARHIAALQIRGSKEYFSINILKINIEVEKLRG